MSDTVLQIMQPTNPVEPPYQYMMIDGCKVKVNYLPKPSAPSAGKGSSPLHNIQSPQRPGHLLHAIGDSPSAAGAKSPSHSIHPRLGVRSRHHEVHRYAKQRIFRPFLAAGKAD